MIRIRGTIIQQVVRHNNIVTHPRRAGVVFPKTVTTTATTIRTGSLHGGRQNQRPAIPTTGTTVPQTTTTAQLLQAFEQQQQQRVWATNPKGPSWRRFLSTTTTTSDCSRSSRGAVGAGTGGDDDKHDHGRRTMMDEKHEITTAPQPTMEEITEEHASLSTPDMISSPTTSNSDAASASAASPPMKTDTSSSTTTTNLRPSAYNRSHKHIPFVPLTTSNNNNTTTNNNMDLAPPPSPPPVKEEVVLPNLAPPKLRRKVKGPRASNPSKFRMSWQMSSSSSSSPHHIRQRQRPSVSGHDDPPRHERTTRNNNNTNPQTSYSMPQQHPSDGPLCRHYLGDHDNNNNKDHQSSSHQSRDDNNDYNNNDYNYDDSSNGTPNRPPNHRQRREYRRQRREQQRQQQQQRTNAATIAQHLMASGEYYVPSSDWIIVQHIQPVSSLETMVEGINKVLDRVLLEQGGIVDLDAVWDPLTAIAAATTTSSSSSSQQQTTAGGGLLPLLDAPSMFPHLVVPPPTDDNDTVDEAENDATKGDDNNHQQTATADDVHHLDVVVSPQNDLYRWVHEAHLVLSRYGRPCGWKIKLANRSIVSALLSSTQQREPLTCGWKTVTVQEWFPPKKKERQQQTTLQKNPRDNKNGSATTNGEQQEEEEVPRVEISFPKISENENIKSLTPIGNNRMYYDDLDTITLDWLDDSVVRVENCPDLLKEQDLLHIFSRYDLKAPSMVRWSDSSHIKKTATTDANHHLPAPPSPIFFVRFADPSWARAALREKQSTVVLSQAIRLVQFPKQLIPQKRKQQRQHEEPKQ